MTFVGAGGIKINHLFSAFPSRLPPSKFSFFLKFREVLRFRPDALLLFLGDNDIRANTCPEELACRLIALASMVQRRFKIKHIIFSQVLPRHGVEHELYNDKAFLVNKFLALFCKDHDGIFFQHCGFSFPGEKKNGRSKFLSFCKSKSFFLQDGIHLSDSGYLRILKKIKNTVVQEATHASWGFLLAWALTLNFVLQVVILYYFNILIHIKTCCIFVPFLYLSNSEH